MKFSMGGKGADRTDMTPDLSRGLSFARGFLEGLVHPQVAGDALAGRRHRLFILRHLALGGLALALLPLSLAFHGATTPALALAFAWLTAHLPLAMYVSRTGELARGQAVSAGFFALFIAALAAMTGGLASPVLAFLALVPLEAVLAGSRRTIMALLALALALLAALAVFAESVPALVGPAPSGTTLAAIATAAALLYGTLLALRAREELAMERQRAQEAEARHEQVAALRGDAVAVILSGGRLQSVTPSVRAVLGLGPVDIQGERFFERLHVADRPLYLKTVSDTLADGRPRTLELRLRRGNGRPGDPGRPGYGWVALDCNPAPSPGLLPLAGLPAGSKALVCALRDIDARKVAEAERDTARAAATDALQARTRFLATVGDELRAPLSAILGFSEVMRAMPRAGLDEARIADYAGLIHRSGSHLLGSLDDMLEMARLEAGDVALHAESFDLRACLDDCRRALEPDAAARRQTIATDMPLQLGPAIADPRACRQIALKLISNALKFTPEGGRVVVFARKGPAGLVFGVRDTGIGIAPEDRERVMQPFVRLAEAEEREGAGVGLAVVNALVDLHGGHVEIESRLGEGACISVLLPNLPEGAIRSRGTAACAPLTASTTTARANRGPHQGARLSDAAESDAGRPSAAWKDIA